MTPKVAAGLQKGEAFCRLLEQEASLANQAPRRLSPRTVAANELMHLVFALPEGKDLMDQTTRVRKKLERIRRGASGGDVREIRRYFIDFAQRLRVAEQLQRRMATSSRYVVRGKLY